MRRMEDKIRSLCHEIVVTKDDDRLASILKELREAVHLHIESLRARLSEYPISIEQREHSRGTRSAAAAASSALTKPERWVRLCAEASVETDAGNMLRLVQEINRLLEEKEQRLADLRRGLSKAG
jgi:hypothetical protein